MKKAMVIAEIIQYLQEELTGIGAHALDRQREIEQLLLMYRFLPRRDFEEGAVVCPGSLIELHCNGTSSFCFIAPQGGGLVTRVEGVPVQVVTPRSPMGEALLGKKAGESVELRIRETVRRYQLQSVR